jgi:hypothetical protein
MGYCCVRSRSRRHVSPMLIPFLLLVADFYIGHTRQLRGSDLSSIPLPPLRATLSTSFVAVLVPTASLIGRPWNCFMFLASWVTFIISVCLDIFHSIVISMVLSFL